MTATLSARNSLESWLGDEAEYLLNYTAKFPKDKLHLPSPDVVDRIYANSDRTKSSNKFQNSWLRDRYGLMIEKMGFVAATKPKT
jgi:hypothetical protein